MAMSRRFLATGDVSASRGPTLRGRSRPAAPVPWTDMRARSTDLREQRIARQIEVVLAQEEALDKRRTELREREDRLIQREEELERRRKDVEFAWSQRTSDLDERERIVEAR